MENIIEIEGLEKSYGDVKAVDGITFNVKSGSLFAFLGVNGAGKSTTINILCSILLKDKGKVTVYGKDIDRHAEEIKQLTGIVFQSTVLDDKLTVRENLSLRASFYGIRGAEFKKRLDFLSGLMELDEILSRPFGKLSGGQKRRADIARGLINAPKVLFLDEPTTGLDPMTRQNVWALIDKLRLEDGMTVFLTTHYMEEADKADDVVIIDKGRIIANGSPISLKSQYAFDCVKLYRPKSSETDDMIKKSGLSFTYGGGSYNIAVASATDAAAFIAAHKDEMGTFEVLRGSMDDVFLNATGRKFDGGDAL
mgnify:FL=1